MRRLIHIEQIPIDVMLEDKVGGIKPVVENLAPHNVSTHPPTIGVTLLAEPVMAENLGIKVVSLEGGMVDVHLGTLEEEEAVVVYPFFATVEAQEDGFVDALVVVDELIVVGGIF